MSDWEILLNPATNLMAYDHLVQTDVLSVFARLRRASPNRTKRNATKDIFP